MAAMAPVVFIFGGIGVLVISVILFWERIAKLANSRVDHYASWLERAAIPVTRETISRVAFGVIMAVVLPSVAIVFVFHLSAVESVLLLLALSALARIGAPYYVNLRIRKRLKQFNNQLDGVLRLIVSALRVGLGLRQALTTIINDLPEPASVEFRRVLVQTSIGASMNDSMEQLAKRMPSPEMTMVVQVIRVQSQTGGNLGGILLNLCETIKQRRRLEQRIRTMTSQARSSKYIISALPVVVGGIIMITQPDMRDALLTTLVGRLVLATSGGLLATGWFVFDMLSKLDI